ncbi:alpha-N-acetylglucosaminidase [Rhizomicrobium electricum]|uniref:Alpha-N-acetylglucosaminidase n=1 Tax=Rhizomicrobium electricum TaxID=480070 RepID=A0ABP3PTG6_9PROT|nr:alpha-N-acetylglucosaminidase [Rhizomicrobium electricum]NIJ48915.1 alpha-N-acetylglucosaminidase [Rhizomicrobium electricum]
MWTRRGFLIATGTSLATSGAYADGAHTVRVLLSRLIGSRADAFDFRLEPGSGQPYFAVTTDGDTIRITADSPVGLARGAYAYLGHIGAAQMNWEGTRVALPARLPPASIPRSPTPFRHRAYLNPCAFGYTTPFWDWARWERELDWMALHGIDMPLAMDGQEFVWRALWQEAGLSEAELDAYFCGPAFLPWQRMGNIEGHGGPLPQRWIARSRDIQLKFMARCRDLAMTPILPAFAGYVPKAFAVKHLGARIHRMEPWGGFHETYWLEPTDPLFAQLQRRFLDLYTAEYGDGTYYLADAFNEMKPPVGSDRFADLARYGKALFDSLHAVKPKAVQVMQGWLFGIDPEFWTPDSVKAFLRDVPDDKLMVLDIANDTYPGVWEKQKAFGGKSWVFGYIHDFGGNNPLFGDLPLVEKDLSTVPARAGKGRLEGFGVFPEGLNTNSVVYDFMFDRAWPSADAPRDINGWLAEYLRARYGKTDAHLLAAWSDLVQAVYRVPNWRSGWWKGAFGCYLFTKRPDPALADFGTELGDHALLARAVKALAALSPAYGSEPLFRYDLVAAASHLALIKADGMLLQAIKTDDARAWQEFERILNTVDALLGAQPFGLPQWLEEARACGTTPAEQAYYIENAKLQVTLWGGDAVLKDYASKAWHGLIRHFYLPRWRAFRAARGKEFDAKRFTADLIAWENAWVRDGKVYVREVPARPLDDVNRLLGML